MPPITAKRLRKIIKGLGDYEVPFADDLAVFAAVLTGMQYCNLPLEQEFSGFPIRLLDVRGNKVIIRAPLWPPGVHPCDWDDRAFGHPRFEKPTNWLDLAPDMEAAFLKAMKPTNPRRKFGKRFAVARFLEEVIPLITGETPSAATIGQQLIQPRKRKRPRKRVR
jgi:hypothetical protein